MGNITFLLVWIHDLAFRCEVRRIVVSVFMKNFVNKEFVKIFVDLRHPISSLMGKEALLTFF